LLDFHKLKLIVTLKKCTDNTFLLRVDALLRSEYLFFLLFIIPILMGTSSSMLLPVSAQPKSHVFLEDWFGVKFTLNVTVDETWMLPKTYDVSIKIRVTDMGGNQHLWINDIKVGVSLYVEERLLVDRYLYSTGDEYSAMVSLKSDTAFSLLKPGDTGSYKLYLDIRGKVKDKYGFEWSGWTYESFDIDVYAPPAPVKITSELPPKIVVNDTFSLKVSVTNEGDYPITDLEVEISEPFGAIITGDKTYALNKLDPKSTETFTFQLKATLPSETSTTAYVSYKSVNGYKVYRWSFPFCEKKIDIVIGRIPTMLTCAVSSGRITKGDSIIVSGSLTPPMREFITLTFTRPDGTTFDRTVQTGTDGTYSYQYTPDATGGWSVKASWAGSLYYEGSSSTPVSFTVEEKRCIIATATYGSELTPEVMFLRGFRDGIVMNTFAGRSFMKVFNAWYYSFSPAVASMIAANDVLRNLTKIILYPLIGVLRLATATYSLFSFNPELGVVAAGFVASSLIATVYFTPCFLIICFIKRLEIPVKAIYVQFLSLALSTMLILLAELTQCASLMMLSTSIFVLTTISLVMALSIKYPLKLIADIKYLLKRGQK